LNIYRGAIEAHPGVTEVHLGVIECHPGVVRVHPEVVKAHLAEAETRHVVIEIHPGVVNAFPEFLKCHPGAVNISKIMLSESVESNCCGPCKPDSRCRLSKAHIKLRKTPGGRDFGTGRGWGGGWKWGDQFTSNLGPRWTGSYHIKEGFQVSKGKWKRGKGESERGKQKTRGLRHNYVINLYACT
jgi:hypothetical protein